MIVISTINTSNQEDTIMETKTYTTTDIKWTTYARNTVHESETLSFGLRGKIIKSSGQYRLIIYKQYERLNELVFKGIREAKKEFVGMINNIIAEMPKTETEIMEVVEIIEDQEIDLNEIMGIDTIDEQLFADNSIDDIVGIDLIDSQLFATGKENDVNIDDLIVELDDNNWLTSYALSAIDNVMPIGFMVLKSGDDLLKIFGRNTIARVLIGGESKLNIIWHNESLPGINIDTVMEIINDIINDPDDLLFGKGIKVELV